MEVKGAYDGGCGILEKRKRECNGITVLSMLLGFRVIQEVNAAYRCDYHMTYRVFLGILT